MEVSQSWLDDFGSLILLDLRLETVVGKKHAPKKKTNGGYEKI